MVYCAKNCHGKEQNRGISCYAEGNKADIIYKEDSTVKNARAVRRHLEKKHQPAYTYEICENLNLSQGDYADISLMFSNFAGCNFSDSSLKNTTILFSDFKNTIIRNANLEKAQIFDTDFSGAVLENISFKGAKLKKLSFIGAELINVKFEGVLLAEELSFDQVKLVDTVIPENK